jgi:Mg2+ and Co2+ transporter CorA
VGAFTKKKTAQTISPLAVLVDIRESLAGYGDASLLQQVRMLRQDIGDRLVAEMAGTRKESAARLEAIRQIQADVLGQLELSGRVQQKVLHDMADGANDKLVAALQRVVTDFNHKVASQFGENYRELGDAVRQMLTWQQDYRDTIHSTNEQLADTLRQLGYAASDFRTVTTGSERFAQTAERVAQIMDGIEAGENRLMVLARSVAKVTEDASGRIPFIENRIAELTSQMMRAVEENQFAVHKALTGSAAELQRTVQAVQAELSGASQAGAAGVQEHQQAIASALQDNAASMATALHAAQGDLTSVIAGFESRIAAMIEAAGQRIVELDGSAAAGLTQSVGNLVGSLSAQLEAASAGFAERAPRPRPLLHVVGDTSVAAEQ